MQDLTGKLHAVLATYHDWGLAALECLLAGRHDEFFVLMERRALACRCIQQLDEAAGLMALDGSMFKDLWQQIDLVNGVLHRHMTRLHAAAIKSPRRRATMRLVKSA